MSKKKTRLPTYPGRVLTRALQLGLSAVANLARYRVKEQTKHLYYGSEKSDPDRHSGIKHIWENALREYRQSVKDRLPDSGFLQRAETNVRRNHYKIHFNNSVKYGNTEEKRKRREEDKRYLNILMDYSGSRLRDIGAVNYLFPEKQRILIDGKELLGYMGTSRIPLYIPRHKAPELDFMDMIRGHLDVLQIQCLRYNVPLKNAIRFSDELIFVLLPYLDYVYTEGRTGKGNFTQDSLKELRQIILKMRALFGRRNGRGRSLTDVARDEIRDSMTSHLEEGQENPVLDESYDENLLTEISEDERDDGEGEDSFENFWSQFIKTCDTEIYPEWKKYVTKAKQLVRVDVLRQDDASFIYDLLREDSRQAGVRFHRYISNSDWTVNPFSTYQALRQSSDVTRDFGNLLFFSELPILNGRGRIDLTVSELVTRQRGDGTEGDSVFRPRVIVDYKTKSAYNVDLYATKTKSEKDPKRRVVEPDFERRRLTAEEWDEVVRSTPTDYEKKQLEIYEKALLDDYKRIVANQDIEASKLSKGILVIDAEEDWSLIRDSLGDCILEAFSNPNPNQNAVYHLEVNGRRLHAAVVVLPHSDALEFDENALENDDRLRPFQLTMDRKDDREFMLYLPVAGRGSPSRSAAKIAGSWYLLQHLHRNYGHISKEILWLDLIGEYENRELRSQRLRFDAHSKEVQEFARAKIHFIDMSKTAKSVILAGESIGVFRTKLMEAFSSSEDPIVVVSGYDTLRQIAQPQRRKMLDEVILLFLELPPVFSSLVWIDQPVPLTTTCQTYGQRCVAPFYPTSPWTRYIDRIIWNLPMYPYRANSFAPADDDFRLVVEETREGYEKELVQIGILYRWGERFRSDSENGIEHNESIFLKGGHPSDSRGRSSRTYSEEDFDVPLELLPHLGPDKELTTPHLRIVPESNRSDYGESPTILRRISFTPFQLKTVKKKDKRIKLLEPLRKINYPRQYRATKLYGKAPKLSTRPPHEQLLVSSDFSEDRIVSDEIYALKKAIRILKRELGQKHKLSPLIKSIQEFIRNLSTDSKDGFHDLQVVRRIIEKSVISEKLWIDLRRYRSYPSLRLDRQGLEFIDGIRLHHPDIFLITGNDLFLLMLAALVTENATTSVHLLEELWDCVLPWQLVRLGLIPKYPQSHTTGESVFSSSMVFRTLRSTVRNLSKLLDSSGVDDILFGQIVDIRSEKDGKQTRNVWLFFQSHPGSREMNAISLPTRYFTDDLQSSLKSISHDKPFWGENDLTQMSSIIRDTKSRQRVSIMVARQNGARGLWILNSHENIWMPVGLFDFYPIKHESVTLVRSIIIQQDESLASILSEDTREIPSSLSDLVDTSLGIIGVSYASCESARCKISLDYSRREYKLQILKRDSSGKGVKEFETNTSSTNDIIELLRRPGFNCEPVVIQGKALVWNRFRDIEYEGDAILLKPWVERNDPFKGTEIALPVNSDALIQARRKAPIEIAIHHHNDACPLFRQQNASAEEITKEGDMEKEEYIRQQEGELGQPDELTSESIYNHGICWSIEFRNGEGLPKNVKCLEGIRLTGASLATLLRTGAVISSQDANWFIHDLKIPNPSSLPREFQECVHLIDAYRQVVPNAVMNLEVPGTVLHERGEMWIISLTAYVDHIIWTGKSDITTQYFQNGTFTIPLNFGSSLQEMEDSILTSIKGVIPSERILNLGKLRQMIRGELRKAGFHDRNVSIKTSEKAAVKTAHIRSYWEMLNSHTQLKQKSLELQRKGEFEEAVAAISGDISELENDFHQKEEARVPLIDALLTKAEILSEESSKVTVTPQQLLDILGQVRELSMGLERRILSSRSEFARRIRWAFTLRERLTK